MSPLPPIIEDELFIMVTPLYNHKTIKKEERKWLM